MNPCCGRKVGFIFRTYTELHELVMCFITRERGRERERREREGEGELKLHCCVRIISRTELNEQKKGSLSLNTIRQI